MNLRSLAALLAFWLAACGGDDETTPDAPTQPADAAQSDGPPPIDAPLPIDAPSSVQLIANCDGIANPDHTISAAGGSYDPQNSTIQVNEVVRFIPGSSIHDMQATNGEFQTPLGEETCLRFTAAGTFPFQCSIHGFSGSITVQ